MNAGNETMPSANGTPAQALTHLRVIELSDRIAGAFCTKFFADFGADVIKVERPVGGDPVRRMGPFKGDQIDGASGGLHLFLNTNKKSVTLDPSTATGAVLLKELLRDADAFIETMRPGVLASWGLAPEELEKQFPQLIVTSVTDFGQSGPYRDYRATDLVHWSLASLMINMGLAGREPLRAGEDVSEFVAGLNAAGATLGMLYGREEIGAQRCDVSALESLITALPSTALGYSYRPQLTPRSGNRFPISIMPCKDGYIGFYTMLQHQWEFFTVLLDMTHLQDDPRFATPLTRLQHADAVMSLVAPWFKERTADEIVARGQELRIPMIKVASAEDVAKSPQLAARGFFADLGTVATGPVQAPGRPFVLASTPWQLMRAAPEVGQDNEPVFCGMLGLSKDDLVILSEQGVV